MKPRERADQICQTLRANGHQAFLAGGCVRDLLLGREPADFDVATDAVPARVQELFPNSNAVGAQFGVILVVDDGTHTEVATFRSDVSYSDGRHPDAVVYSRTPQEDVQRRDFTINGLLIDPQTGEILDYVGGRADLEAKVVRAIGEPSRRFSEDKLRMMRAVRFAARLGYAIEPGTADAIRKHADEITQVSAERQRDELAKILTEGAARRGFELLDELGLLAAVLPEITRMKGVAQPPQFHPEGDVWIHTRLMLEGLAPGCSPTLAWGVLFHDVGKPPTFAPPVDSGRIRFDGHVEVGARMAEEICRRLRFPNDDTSQIVLLVENHLRFKDVSEMRASTLKRFVRLPRFEEHLELHRLDCSSSHRNLEAYEYVSRFLKETPHEQVRPPRILTGDDLRGLGFTPGPVYKEILRVVEDAQLEGRLKDTQGAVEFVRKNFKLAPSLPGVKNGTTP